jgi:hypothetical protein
MKWAPAPSSNLRTEDPARTDHDKVCCSEAIPVDGGWAGTQELEHRFARDEDGASSPVLVTDSEPEYSGVD